MMNFYYPRRGEAMKTQHDAEVKADAELRFWSYGEAVKARSYLRTILTSLREHSLSREGARMRLERLDRRHGRADRETLIQRADAAREVEQADRDFHEAIHELNALDVYSVDPARGLAMIPFKKGNSLAWYVLDLFAQQGLVGWRLHSDPMDTRRPLAEQLDHRLVDQIFASRSADASGEFRAA
jgi:hypothetical protein